MSLERRLELCAAAGIELAIVEPFTREFAAIDAPTRSCATCWRAISARATSSSATTSASAAGGPATRRPLARARGAAGHRRRGDPADRDRRRALLVDAHPRAGAGGRHRRRGAACSAVRSSSRARWCAARGAGAGSASRPPTSPPRASSARRWASTRRARACSTARWRADAQPRRSAWAGIRHFRRRRDVSVEAYLLDFEGDLYDRRLRVEVGERLRDESKFDSIDGAGRADSSETSRASDS